MLRYSAMADASIWQVRTIRVLTLQNPVLHCLLRAFQLAQALHCCVLVSKTFDHTAFAVRAHCFDPVEVATRYDYVHGAASGLTQLKAI